MSDSLVWDCALHGRDCSFDTNVAAIREIVIEQPLVRSRLAAEQSLDSSVIGFSFFAHHPVATWARIQECAMRHGFSKLLYSSSV